MKRDYPEHPIIGVGAVIIHGDRVLLVRRATEPLKVNGPFPASPSLARSRDGVAREALKKRDSLSSREVLMSSTASFPTPTAAPSTTLY
jgi:hypothetical protein